MSLQSIALPTGYQQATPPVAFGGSGPRLARRPRHRRATQPRCRDGATTSLRIGRYEVLRQIASGGAADIFLAAQVGEAGFRRQVVIKRLCKQLATDAGHVRAFIDEARLQAELNHPNIAQVIHLGREDNQYYSVFEYIDGPDLRSVIDSLRECSRTIAPSLAVYIAARAAAGLHAAHTAVDKTTGNGLRIVHRDVSPENVVLSRHGAVKVIDFGAAHHDQRTPMTRYGHVRGKIGYLAPERVRDEPYDHRADIFGLGVLLVEMMVGYNPWLGASTMESLSRIVGTTMPSLQQLGVGGVDGRLEAIVARCLHKRPEHRYDDALMVAEDLDAWLLAAGGNIDRASVAAALADLFPGKIPNRHRRSGRRTRPSAPAVASDVITRATPRPCRSSARDGESTVKSRLRCRLITVTGDESLDRTRKAMKACQVALANTSAADVVWIRAGGVASHYELDRRVADALRPLDRPSVPGEIIDLNARLRRGPMVLLLDDVDGIPALDAVVAEWLHMADELRIVCTTQRPLGLTGEKVVKAR